MTRRAAATAGLILGAVAALAQGRGDPVVTSLTLFAGTPAGLWRSGDWAGNWEKAQAGAVHAILPIGPRVLAAGDNGLLVSEDFGLTWKATEVGGAALNVLPSRYPLADPTVFLGTPGGLLKSEDGGRTFKPTSLGGTPVRRLEWPGPDLVVASGRGVLVSSDGARSFREPGAGLPPGEVRSLVLSSFFAADPVMFAGAGSEGVFRSSDGGRTWKASGLGGHAVNDLVWLGPFLYAATDRGVYRSEDAGGRWSLLGKGLDGRNALRLMFPLAPAAGMEAFLGTDSGIFRTTDGGATWKATGLTGETILALATFPPPEPVPAKSRRQRQ